MNEAAPPWDETSAARTGAASALPAGPLTRYVAGLKLYERNRVLERQSCRDAIGTMRAGACRKIRFSIPTATNLPFLTVAKLGAIIAALSFSVRSFAFKSARTRIAASPRVVSIITGCPPVRVETRMRAIQDDGRSIQKTGEVVHG